MRRNLILLSLTSMIFLTGCMSIKPLTPSNSSRATRPIFDAIAVDGPVIMDMRPAGYTTSFSSSHINTSYGFANGSSSGMAFHSEAFENHEYEELLRYSLEDRGLAEKVFNHGESAHYKLEARALPIRDVSNWKMSAWAFMDGLTLLALVGVPFVADSECEVQMRIYDDEKMIATVSGVGKIRMVASLFTAITAGPQAKREVIKLAIANGIDQIIEREAEIKSGIDKK